jgi:hypothetical protein
MLSSHRQYHLQLPVPIEKEEQDKIESLCKVSEKFIMNTILHYLENCLKPAYEKQRTEILQNSGKCLRFDYTYDFVSSLKGYDKDSKQFVLLSTPNDRFV